MFCLYNRHGLIIFYLTVLGIATFVVVVVVVVVNFIKHQNRAITGERVAARAAPSYQYAMVLLISRSTAAIHFLWLKTDIVIVQVVFELCGIS